MARILIVVETDDDSDADPDDATGLTEEAHNRLSIAISSAGFSIDDITEAEE